MNQITQYRRRILFTKGEAIKYISHLDLAKTLERTFRRAELPLLYSQGYNPRPKLALASALPVGVAGAREVMDIWLSAPMKPEECLERISAQTPPGIRVLDVWEADLRQSSLQSLTRWSVYKIAVDPVPEDLDARIADLLAQESVMRERVRKRKVKTYDLRPLVDDIWRVPGHPEQIEMRLANRSGATGRADEVAAALGLKDHVVGITRKRLIFADGVLAETHAPSNKGEQA
jgi:radical SAM-linked protein